MLNSASVFPDAKEVEEKKKKKKKVKRFRPVQAQPSTESESSDHRSPVTRRRPKKSRYLRVYEKPLETALEMPQYSSPKFTVPFTDIETFLGDQAILKFRVDSCPEPEISFFRNGVAIEPTDTNYKLMQQKDGEYHFIIKNATLLDDAEYACQAKNLVGEAWCYGDVFVLRSGLI